jgi:carboxyl-terminal processing protease
VENQPETSCKKDVKTGKPMSNKSRNFVLLFIAIVILSIIASRFDAQIISLNPEKHSKKENLSKFDDVIKLIDNVYVDDVNWNHSVEGAINGLLETLDPHSIYITPSDAEINEENFEGKYQGIGIHFDVVDGYVTVISVIPGSPSEEAGLQAGDKIIKINGESAYQLSTADVPKKLKGPAGSMVDVTIQRFGVENPIEISIKRDEIPIYTVNTYFKADQHTGYVWLNRFAKTTASELEDALMELETQGIDQLILDLRGNGGGLLKEAVKVVAKFIPGHEIVVYTKGRFSRYDEEFYTDDFEVSSVREYPLIVLIDAGSASASEIVAGAIQDYDRGLIVGTNSFGKGLVQNEFVLSDKSRIRLTVSRYYTPSGRLIQKPYKNRNLEDYYNGVEIDSIEKAENSDSTYTGPVFYTKGGRKVLGGGGIKPDVEVKFNSISKLPDLTRELIQKRIIFELASELVSENPQWAESFGSFNRDYELDTRQLKRLLKIAMDKNISISKGQIEADQLYLKNRIKADIARNIWGMSKYYEVILEYDNQFQESLKLFPKAQQLQGLADEVISQK